MVVLILLLLVAVCIAGLLYVIYSFSPEARWRRRVHRAKRQIKHLKDAADHRLAQLHDSWRQQQHRLLQETLDQHLARMSVKELERFPGIGPKTVETLRQVGLDNLQKVRRRLDRLPAELRSRADLVRHAVLKICGEFVQTCQQEPKHLQNVSAPLYEEWTNLQTRYQQDMHLTRESLRRLDELHRELERLYEQYRQVTGAVAFWRRLLLQRAPGLPVAAATSPLSDIESELARLEQSAWATPSRPPIPTATSPAATLPQSPVADSYKNSPTPAAVVPPKAGPVPQPESAPAPTPHRPAPGFTLIRPLSPPAPPAIDPLDLEISLLYMLARSDGRLAQQERAWIADYCLRRYSRDPVLSGRVRSLCSYYEQAPMDTAAILAKLQQCRQDKRWQEIWPELQALASAGNSKNGRKWQTLKQLAEILALPLEAPNESQTSSPPQQVHREQPLDEKRNGPVLTFPPATPSESPLEAPAQAPPSAVLSREQACQLLGLSAHNSLSATYIRQRYRELLPLYNPKQEEIKGPEFVALAEQKRRQLHEAACLLLQQCGIADPQRYLEEQEATQTEYSRDNPTLDAIFGI
jgi:hypothetical protein